MHSTLYKVLFNESCDEYLNYINSFVISYCVLNFKLI